MPTHSETRQMPHSAQQMYDLIADVAKYDEFLPWCAATRIRKEWEKDGRKVVDADLIISFKVFRERFTSRVTMKPEEGPHRRGVHRRPIQIPAQSLEIHPERRRLSSRFPRGFRI